MADGLGCDECCWYEDEVQMDTVAEGAQAGQKPRAGTSFGRRFKIMTAA